MIVSTITDAGRGAIAAAVAGQKMTFTRFGIGDGELAETETAAGKTALTSEILSLDIAEFTDNGDGTITVGGFFTSADIERAFFYRELGLYATIGDNAEPVLIVYGNAGTDAEYITEATNEQSGEFAEKGIRLRIEINAANVTATIDPAVLATRKYVDDKTAPIEIIRADFEAFKKDALTVANITNCFTALPRNEYTLTNGVLTFKAGSTFYKTDGTEIIIEEDLPAHFSTPSGTCLCWLRYDVWESPSLQIYGAHSCFAGTTAEREAYTASSFWYDTDLLKFFYYDEPTAAWIEIEMTFPAAVAEVADNAVLSVKTFDGLGFFGSLLFATKGVKGLAPNGFEKSGALKNISIELNTVKTYRAVPAANETVDFYINYNGQLGIAPLVYHASENKNFDANGGLFSVINAGKVTFKAGRVVSFNPKEVFIAADNNDVVRHGEPLKDDVYLSTGAPRTGFYISSKNLSISEAPASAEEALFALTDKVGNVLGGIFVSKHTDGMQRVYLVGNNGTASGVIGLDVYLDGTVKALAPTPDNAAVGGEIVTAEWIKRNAGFAFPSGEYVNIDYDFTTAGEHTEVKTAPANGYFLFRGRNTAENLIIGLRFENMIDGLSNHKYGPAGFFVDVFLPVKAGQKIVVFRSAAVTADAALRFFYAG